MWHWQMEQADEEPADLVGLLMVQRHKDYNLVYSIFAINNITSLLANQLNYYVENQSLWITSPSPSITSHRFPSHSITFYQFYHSFLIPSTFSQSQKWVGHKTMNCTFTMLSHPSIRNAFKTIIVYNYQPHSAITIDTLLFTFASFHQSYLCLLVRLSPHPPFKSSKQVLS